MLMTNGKKPITIAVLAAVCIVVILLLESKNTFNMHSPVAVAHHPEVIQSEHQVLKSQILTPQPKTTRKTTQIYINGVLNTVDAEEAQWPTVMGSPANEAEIKNWIGARGYDFGAGGTNEYASYDIDTLEKLAKAGDVRAMKYWGIKIYGTVGGFDKAKESYLNAAIHGSTDAVNSIGCIVEISIYGNAKTQEEKQAALLEVLAWYNSATFRGDRWPNVVSAQGFINVNHIQLTEQDREKIQVRSQEIYDDLLQKRRALGLGDFDNFVPESVNRYFDFLEGK